MELYVKEMPKNCAECKYYLRGSSECSLIIDSENYNERVCLNSYNKKCLENCTLKPLPKCEINNQNELNLLNKIEKLRNQISDDNQLISDLREQLAVCKRALYNSRVEITWLRQPQWKSIENIKEKFEISLEFDCRGAVEQAKAELKAEKGEEK